MTSHASAGAFWVLTRKKPSPVAWNCHCWDADWLQANCCTTVPFAVPADRASTHFPLFNAVTVYQPSGVIAACAGGAALTSPTINADAASAAARLVFIGPSSAAGHGVVRAGIGRGSPG